MIYLSNSKLEHHIGEWFEPECIVDIAFRLSDINRFNGSVGAYSVAQHSVLVAQQLPDELKLAGLLHDVCEAYLGDITSPLKKHIRGYDELESFYCDVIDKHYGVETRHPLVKEADLRVFLTEAESFGLPMEIFEGRGEPYDFTVQRMTPEEAAYQFVALYKELRHGINV
jgi:hypothetical protein